MAAGTTCPAAAPVLPAAQPAGRRGRTAAAAAAAVAAVGGDRWRGTVPSCKPLWPDSEHNTGLCVALTASQVTS